MSRFRIKKKRSPYGPDEETWRTVLGMIERKGGATEEDVSIVLFLVASMYEHPHECPRCHRQTWKLYGFSEPGTMFEPLWLPAGDFTHYRHCENLDCGFQDLSKFETFSSSSGRLLSVTFFADVVVGVEFVGMEEEVLSDDC
jgi:hypothetical protein